MGDTYTFWGMVQSEGPVTPANLDIEVYYTPDSVRNNLDGLKGTEVRFIHTGSEYNPDIGEVIDYEILKDNLFVLNQIEEDKWDNFRETLQDEENVNIGASFNQLTEEIDAGNLALSAGLRNAITTTTPEHENTVIQYDWREVSLVPSPANPGAWAWGCDDQCQTVFQQTMAEQDVEIETDDPEGGDTVEQGDVETEPQHPKTIELGDEEFQLVPTEEVEQGECSCNTEKLERELEQAREERDEYKEALEQFEQKRRDQVSSQLEQLNEELPENKAYDEEELEQMCEDESISSLERHANLMQRLLPENDSENLEQEEEDLSGASGGNSEEFDQKKEKIDQISQEIFGDDLDSVLSGMEEDYGR